MREKINWDKQTAAHLLNRSGFGGRLEEIETFTKLGMEKAVKQLLSSAKQTFPKPPWLDNYGELFSREKLRTLSQKDKKELRRQRLELMKTFKRSWLQFMIESPTPADMLRNKMAFFWHGHFVSSSKAVKHPDVLYKQCNMLHDHAMRNYGSLLHAMVRDPAMLMYLDNDRNQKGKPNENLARELMELFSLGIGHYTEKDIEEGARALTGYGIKSNNGSREFNFNSKRHDKGEKVILGVKSRLNGNQFVDIILKQTVCADFMTQKIWHYFAGREGEESVIADLANTFRKENYAIKLLLYSIFTHPEFYHKNLIGQQIKSPIQLLVGSARTLQLKVSNPQFYFFLLEGMGQVPYEPPNVAGWPGGREWINSLRLNSRYLFAKLIVQETVDRELFNRFPPSLKRQVRKLKLNYDPSIFLKEEMDADLLYHKIITTFLMNLPSKNQETKLYRPFMTEFVKDKKLAIRHLIGNLFLLPQYQLI